jgi:hypothetical protein
VPQLQPGEAVVYFRRNLRQPQLALLQ